MSVGSGSGSSRRPAARSAVSATEFGGIRLGPSGPTVTVMVPSRDPPEASPSVTGAGLTVNEATAGIGGERGGSGGLGERRSGPGVGALLPDRWQVENAVRFQRVGSLDRRGRQPPRARHGHIADARRFPPTARWLCRGSSIRRYRPGGGRRPRAAAFPGALRLDDEFVCSVVVHVGAGGGSMVAIQTSVATAGKWPADLVVPVDVLEVAHWYRCQDRMAGRWWRWRARRHPRWRRWSLRGPAWCSRSVASGAGRGRPCLPWQPVTPRARVISAASQMRRPRCRKDVLRRGRSWSRCAVYEPPTGADDPRCPWSRVCDTDRYRSPSDWSVRMEPDRWCRRPGRSWRRRGSAG